MLPDVYFGSPEQKPVDWRDKRFDHDSPDDDTEPTETPEDVVHILGFDPIDELTQDS